MTNDEINDIEYSYLQMHYLMNVLHTMMIELGRFDYSSSDISMLFTVIMEKRDKFYDKFEKFLVKLMKEV